VFVSLVMRHGFLTREKPAHRLLVISELLCTSCGAPQRSTEATGRLQKSRQNGLLVSYTPLASPAGKSMLHGIVPSGNEPSFTPSTRN